MWPFDLGGDPWAEMRMMPTKPKSRACCPQQGLPSLPLPQLSEVGVYTEGHMGKSRLGEEMGVELGPE